MVLISYDISDNKKRAIFSKYLKKFGNRLQFSVFQIENSNRVLNNIISDIENVFSKNFDEADSVLILKLSSSCKVLRFGYAAHEDSELLIVK